jgi:hypothetical protein
VTLGHSDLYIQLHKSGVPTKLAETAAGVANHQGIPPVLPDILAAVIAAVNTRCDRVEARLEALQPAAGQGAVRGAGVNKNDVRMQIQSILDRHAETWQPSAGRGTRCSRRSRSATRLDNRVHRA